LEYNRAFANTKIGEERMRAKKPEAASVPKEFVSL
jgi:hypothetical protein